MTLENMIVRVKSRLKDRNETIIFEKKLNKDRNHAIHCEFASYILKWSDSPFFQASKRIEGFGKGIGISIDRDTADHFIKNNYFETDKIFFLYQWTAQKIYYITGAEFQRQRHLYEQTNGEYVYVLPVRTLIAWE